MRTTRNSKGFAKVSKAVLTHRTPKLFPFASELQGALADGFAEGLVGRDDVEPFGLRLVLTLQPTNHAQHATPTPRPRVPHLQHLVRAGRNRVLFGNGRAVGVSLL